MIRWLLSWERPGWTDTIPHLTITIKIHYLFGDCQLQIRNQIFLKNR